MTYRQLLEFVQNYMPKKMQHIYLPLLIGKLVDADGSAPLRQLAEGVLANGGILWETTKGDALDQSI
jgi:hypothetical protein